MKLGEHKGIYEHWERTLKNDLSENWLAALENSIVEWEKSANDMEGMLENRGDAFSQFEKIDFRKTIRQRRALVKQLKELLKRYENVDPEKSAQVGNPKFRNNKIDMPEGFYNDADKLKSENPDKSNSWIYKKLDRQFFKGDESKISTIRRRLKDHWR